MTQKLVEYGHLSSGTSLTLKGLRRGIHSHYLTNFRSGTSLTLKGLRLPLSHLYQYGTGSGTSLTLKGLRQSLMVYPHRP